MTLPKKLSKLLLFPLFAVSLFALEKDASAAMVTKISVSDTFIGEGESSAGYWSLGYAYVGFISGGEVEERALFKFDLSDISSSAIVSSAKLRIYKEATYWPTTSVKAYILRNMNNWSENTVNWENRPGMLTTGVFTTIHESTTWVAWDVTELVKDWVDGTSQNYGLTVAAEDTGAYQSIALSTSNDSDGNKPELLIDYTVPLSPALFRVRLPSFDTAAPGISEVAASGITDVQTVVSWKTSEEATSFVDFGETVAYGSTTGSEDKVSTHSVILSNLEPEITYHFRVRSKDAAGNEATSGDYNFKTTAEAGAGAAPPPAPPNQPGTPPAGSPSAPVGGTAPVGAGETGLGGQKFPEYEPGAYEGSGVEEGSRGDLTKSGIFSKAGLISKVLWGVVGALGVLILVVSGFLVYTLIGKRKGASAGGIDGVVGKKRSRKKSKEYEE